MIPGFFMLATWTSLSFVDSPVFPISAAQTHKDSAARDSCDVFSDYKRPQYNQKHLTVHLAAVDMVLLALAGGVVVLVVKNFSRQQPAADV